MNAGQYLMTLSIPWVRVLFSWPYPLCFAVPTCVFYRAASRSPYHNGKKDEVKDHCYYQSMLPWWIGKCFMFNDQGHPDFSFFLSSVSSCRTFLYTSSAAARKARTDIGNKLENTWFLTLKTGEPRVNEWRLKICNTFQASINKSQVPAMLQKVCSPCTIF